MEAYLFYFAGACFGVFFISLVDTPITLCAKAIFE